MGVPRELKDLWQRRELGPEVWLQWDRLPATQELRKALRLAEAQLRYGNGAAFDIEALARADGLFRAIQIIERFTNPNSNGEE